MASPKRVLVVEDDESLADGLRAYFESLGCVVDLAKSYSGGCDMLDAHLYALIVSDNKMPINEEPRPYNNAGIELLARAKGDFRHKTMPMVLHTADDTEKIREAVEVVGIYYAKKGDRDTLPLFAKLLDH